MTKILLSGAGGYIGSVATYLFLQNGYEVVAVDNFSTGFRQPLELLQEKFGKDMLRIYEAELTSDLSPIFDGEDDIDVAVHYASRCLVRESMEIPEVYFQNNICGALNLLDHMLKNDIKNFVFSSTCAVYGEAKYSPVDEEHPTKPTNPYGESKRIVEEIIQWLAKLKGLNFVILRYFNVCGASDDGLVGDSKKPSVLLVQNALRGALDLEPFYLTFQEVDTPDKSPIRDYVNVVDLNEAHLKAVEYLLGGGSSEIVNIGTGTGNSVLEIIKEVEKITGVQIKAQKAANPRSGEYAKMIAEVDKAKKVLGWEPKRSIEISVKSLITWYKAHPQGWDN